MKITRKKLENIIKEELTVNRYSNELSLLEEIKNRANSVSPLINSLAELAEWEYEN